MARKDIGTGWDRNNRNAINDNFKELYNEYLNAGMNAKEAREKADEAILQADRTENELSQAILKGDSSPLGGQLSVGVDGTIYGDPQERLVKENKKITTQLADVPTQIENAVNPKADKVYVDDKLTKIGSGKPSGVFPTLYDLQSAYPEGNDNIYVVVEDGKWYYWSGTSWKAGGLYNATVSDEMIATNIIRNGNFEGYSNWYAGRATITTDENILNLEADGTHDTPYFYQHLKYSLQETHKIYFKARVKINDSNVEQIRFNLSGNKSNYEYFDDIELGKWKDYSTIKSMGGSDLKAFAYVKYSNIPNAGSISEFQYLIALDLTEVFGNGNEPSTSEVDKMMSKFKHEWFDGNVSPLLSKEDFYSMLKDVKSETDFIKEIKKGVKPSNTTFFEKSKNLFDKNAATEGHYINYNNGQLIKNDIYVASDFIEVKPLKKYSFIGDSVRVAFYDELKNYVSGESDPVSPVTIPNGVCYVRFSFSAEDVDNQQFEEGSEQTIFEPYAGWFFDTNLIKNESIPASKINGELNNKNAFDPSEIIVDMNPDDIYFFIKTSGNNDKYLKYRFTHETRPYDGETSNGNLDAWRLRDLYEVIRIGEYDFTDNYSESFMTSGVWEFALREEGMDNFMGGGHGSEIMTNAFIRLDGIEKHLGMVGKFKCKSIDFVQKSTIYRWLTKTPVANTVKMYEINAKDGIRLTTEVNWTEGINLIAESYLPMLPIKRFLTDGVTQITDRFYRDAEYEVIDVSTSDKVKSSEANKQKNGVEKAVIWGSDSGISAEVKILERPDISSEKMYVTGSKLYNKFYFMVTGDEYTTTVGENWKSVVLFNFNVTN